MIETIIAKSQEELDKIPSDFNGFIIIDFGTVRNPAVVKPVFSHYVTARGNSHIEARGNSFVVAFDNSRVVALVNSYVEARKNSRVEAHDNSRVVAFDNSNVAAYENSNIEARENSWVAAQGNSHVEALENSYVEAWENSRVEAYENSNVVAYENSNVVAYDNSHVEAWGNVQLVNKQSLDGRIKVFGNARIVFYPKTIDEYMSFYGLEHDKKKGIFYKAVHRYGDGTYHSQWNPYFTYSVGDVIKETCDSDVNNECSFGIHMAHLRFALEYGSSWSDLAILEVESDLDKIVIPSSVNGKVRTSEIRVIREVPLEECGIYGKIIAEELRNKK